MTTWKTRSRQARRSESTRRQRLKSWGGPKPVPGGGVHRSRGGSTTGTGPERERAVLELIADASTGVEERRIRLRALGERRRADDLDQASISAGAHPSEAWESRPILVECARPVPRARPSGTIG